jgi:mycothiol system anti-sigma-R factor
VNPTADPIDDDPRRTDRMSHTEPTPSSPPIPPSPSGAPDPDGRTDHDCDDAVAQLYSFLDGELDAVTVTKVEEHLKHCSPCLEAFDFEAELRKVVAVKCRDRVPDELRTRILTILEGLGDTTADEPDTPA